VTVGPPPLLVPAAEVRPALAGCDGSVVSSIAIRTYPPSETTAAERAAAAATDAVGIDRRSTRAYVIRAYVLLHEGENCTEALRAESERLLRAQRFVASASVTTSADGPERVRVRVDVVEEAAWTAGARARGARPVAAHVGSQNVRGRGITTVVGFEQELGYREGYSLLLGQSGALGRPALADAEYQLRPLGELWRVTYSEPVLTAGQRQTFHAGAVQESGFPTLVRGGPPDVVVRTRRAAYHAGWIRQVGNSRPGGLVALGGLLVMGTHIESGTSLAIQSDSGLLPTTDNTLVGMYRPHANGRIGVITGVRSLSFRTVRRFETLRAVQDVATGFDTDVLLAPSMNRSSGARDHLVAGNLFFGRSGPTSYRSLKLRAEGRRTGRAEPWEGVVASARISSHRLVSPTRTRILTATAATVQNLSFPAQLTFRDHEGGLAGFPEGGDAGGTRAVLRLEERRLLPWLSRRVGLATSWFADAGQLWAGDVPYGRNSPVRGSLGVSFIASYPATSKRMYRVDLAVPVNPGPGDARFVVRFLTGDRTGVFWSEPRDVSRARASATPVPLVRW
jgi:hypothetical protein